MTVMTTETPVVGKDRHSKGIETMESRVIGVEVFCGSIETIFIYFTDNLVSSGANIMVEVQRQALKDLAILLKAQNQEMPKEFIFQFDNCGENKVI